MNITVEKQPNCVARIRVEVPADAVTKERRQIVQAFSQQARIPGFRPGKVPTKVIEKRFATEIASELESRLVSQAYDEAVKQEELRILDAKSPDEQSHLPDGTFQFSSNLVLAPDFELPAYKELTLEIPEREVGEEDINRELEQLQNRMSDFNEISDRALAEGDFAIIDYSATLDGKPLGEALEEAPGFLTGGEGFWHRMDDESILPGFSKELEGAAIEEEREFDLEVPEEFPVEELRSATLRYKVKVNAIKEQVLPELNDELADKVLPGKTLAEVKELIQEQLESQLAKQLQDFKVNQLVEKLSALVEFDLPEDLLNAETQGQADEMVERGIQQGMSEDQIEAQQGELFAAAGQRAKLNLKTDFILQEIAQAEELKVTEGELMQRLQAIATQSKKPVKTVAKELQRSGRMRGLQHSILLSKTIDFLLDNAKFETVAADASEDDE